MNKKRHFALVLTTFGMCPVHIHKKTHTTNIFLSPWFSTRLLVQSPLDCLNLWPPPLQCSLLLYYPILQTLQTITGHKIAPTEAFLSPILLLQGVSRARLFSYMPALLFQLSSHGRRLTSTRLLKTVSTDRHKERGVNTLTLKNLPTA